MSNLINVALFYIGWFGIVLSAGQEVVILPLALTALALLVFLISSPNKLSDLRLVLIGCILGIAMDSLVLWLGAFSFTAPTVLGLAYPLWMMCLWVIFATTLRRSLYRVVKRPLLGGLFGAVGGPLSYLAAEALKVLQISQPRAQSLIIIGVEWFAIMMIFYLLVRDLPLKSVAR